MSGVSSCHKGFIEDAKAYLDGGWQDGEVIPSQAGLALALGVSKATIKNWEHQETNECLKEWQAIMNRLRAMSEVKLINGALTKEFDSGTSRLILSTNYGYSEKQALEHSGPNGQPIRTENKVEWTIQPVKPVDAADSDS